MSVLRRFCSSCHRLTGLSQLCEHFEVDKHQKCNSCCVEEQSDDLSEEETNNCPYCTYDNEGKIKLLCLQHTDNPSLQISNTISRKEIDYTQWAIEEFEKLDKQTKYQILFLHFEYMDCDCSLCDVFRAEHENDMNKKGVVR